LKYRLIVRASPSAEVKLQIAQQNNKNMGDMKKIEKGSVSYNRKTLSMNRNNNTSEPSRGGINKTTQNNIDFIQEIEKMYPKNCAYYIRFGDCTNKKCNRKHEIRNHDAYQAELQRKHDLIRAEIKRIKGRAPYCVYFKYGCCYNNNCNKSHRIPEEEPELAPRQVYIPEFSAAEGGELVSRKYLDSALKETTPRPVSEVKREVSQSGPTEKFNGSDLQSRFNICNKTRCSCNKSHNMQNQPRNITNRLFANFMKDNKLPLAELLMKLNAV